MKEIKVGANAETKITVTPEKLAVNVGSGSVEVLATPIMLAIMEEAAAKCLQEFLDDEMTSVGVAISSTHIAATPCGMNATAKATITAVDGKRVDFSIEAFDDREKIGEGTHSRVIVNREKFIQRANSK